MLRLYVLGAIWCTSGQAKYQWVGSCVSLSGRRSRPLFIAQKRISGHDACMAISASKVVKTSFWVDVSDFVINLILAIMSGSAVMLAEALQGAADLLNTGFLWIGLRRSHRRADREHRFGYGREIYFWSLMSALVMLVVTATITFYHGWKHLTVPQDLAYTIPNLLVLAVAMGTNGYALGLSWRRLAEHTHETSIIEAFLTSSLIETKTTLVLDLMGSASAAFGFVSLFFYLLTGDSRFDGLGAVMIAGCIVVLAVFLIFDVKDLLIGRGADEKLESEIKKVAEAVEGVQSVRRVRTMYVGTDQLLVAIDVNFGTTHTPAKINRLIQAIKDDVQAKIPTAKHIQIELET